MSKKISKSLKDCLTKIKTSQRSMVQLSSKKWVPKGCKHPRTPSIDMDKNKNIISKNTTNAKDDEAMLADIDRFLIENFKNLFLDDHREETTTKEQKSPKLDSIRFDSSARFDESPLNLFTDTTTEAGLSSLTMSEPEGVEEQTTVPSNCVVVLANSGRPTEDFRRSMEGMVEARLKKSEKVDWDFMQELLFCHMNLNQKKWHKFILSAFVDVATTLRQSPEISPTKSQPAQSVRTVRIGREVRKKTKEAITLEFGSP
ncbi:Ovate protein family [Vigna unguiculata]|uniref:Transcription repressor n=1 Tax=Vigna unguiculata TaxID=3917 RepID=A0A4D6ML18_VIGUN|nr:Ovate protein family [Vigna unguiculata]